MKKELPPNIWRLKRPPYLEKTDDRYASSMEAIKELGFCDAETWSLRSMTAEWMLPRLKRFREINAGHPGGITNEEWCSILDQMIFAFDFWANEPLNALDIEYEKAKEGMKLFAEWFGHLWW